MNHQSSLNLLAAVAMAALAGITSNAKAVTVGNHSFELYDALTHGDWGGISSSSDPKVVWTFSHYGTDVVGIDNNRLIWYPVAVPDGTAAAYLQSTSSISQPVTFDTAGDYTVSFSVIGRHDGHGPCDMTVMIDGESVLSLTASDISTAAWQTKVSNIFTVAAGTHTIAFATDSKVNGVITGGRSNAIDMVEIKIAAADQADMISCTFPDLGPATIDGTDVSITVPYGTEVTALAPTFTLSPFATSSPPSGTARDFTLPQFYMVRSGDWSNTEIYTVTVNVTPASTACDILTFGSVGNPAVISDTEIAWTVPFSTDLEMLSPSFTLSPNATCDQYSGWMPFPDFSTGPVPYVVTAEDGVTTKTYTVTVTKAPASSACEMLAFGLPGNPAVISGTDITWTVPHGTELATLAASFAVSPFAVCDQLNHSIPTPDFSTGPVQYKVTAEDGVTIKDYTVTITVGPQVNFVLAPLGKTADSTGAEILNTGTLVKAYHFGNGPVDTTVNGVVFTAGNSGTGAPFAATGLSGSSNGMKGWLSGQLGYSFTNAAYAELIDQAYVGGAPVMTVGGLIIGNEYRLQIILQDTRGTPTIEGVTGPTLTPGNPGIITATWVARDDVLNVSWSGGASPHFSGYTLHDMGGGTVPDYDTWANSFGAGFTDRDPASDPDGDGMSNHEEYAFGLNPTSGSSVNPITVPLDKTSGTFSYTRRNPALTGLSYAVLTSTDLVNWMPNGAGGSQTPDSPAAEVQTVTVVVDATPLNGRLFVRVQASD